MSAFLRWLRILGYAMAGAVFGYFATLLLQHLGIQFLSEHAPVLSAGLFGFQGAVMAVYGWKYWIGISLEAYDPFD